MRVAVSEEKSAPSVNTPCFSTPFLLTLLGLAVCFDDLNQSVPVGHGNYKCPVAETQFHGVNQPVRIGFCRASSCSTKADPS